jgi:hypothetical protein
MFEKLPFRHENARREWKMADSQIRNELNDRRRKIMKHNRSTDSFCERPDEITLCLHNVIIIILILMPVSNSVR